MRWLFRSKREKKQAQREAYISLASLGGEDSDFFYKLAKMIKEY